MQSAPKHPHELERLAALRSYDILDTAFEATYDDLTELASKICEVPISLISLVDTERQWFKSVVGVDAKETPREIAFCAHAILNNRVFVVNNALEDKRFSDNPLVTGGPEIRFYAGAPLINKDGYPLGTLCVIDQKPRQFSEYQCRALEILAKQVIHQFELRQVNLTLHRMVDKLKLENEAKGKFLSMLSHDMRTPFNSILGMSHLLQKNLGDFSAEDLKDSIDVVERSAQKALSLFENLLLWSRLEAGGVQCHPIILLVKDIFGELRTMMQGSLGVKKVSLIYEGDDAAMIWCDPNMFFSTLQNLLSNALKFSNSGGLIKVSATSEGKLTTILIEDYGVGMSPETLNKLFQVGHENTSVGTAGERGHGLGLLLSQQFVKANNGEISAQSQLGKGTIFKITLPASQV